VRFVRGALAPRRAVALQAVLASRRGPPARAARSPSPAQDPTEAAVAEPMKACRSCGSVKPLSAFPRHGGTKDGRRHHCQDCTPPRRPTRLEQRIADLEKANAKLTALLVEAYGHIRGGFQSALQRRALIVRIDQGLRWLSEIDMERPPPLKKFRPPVRYQNPDCLEEKWCGRGRMPRWLRAKLDAGAALADLGAPEAGLLREEFAAVRGVVLGQQDHGCRLNPPKALQEGTHSF
jgi:hypothetical protein